MTEEKKHIPAVERGPCDICHCVGPLRDGLCGVCEMDEQMQAECDRDMGDS